MMVSPQNGADIWKNTQEPIFRRFFISLLLRVIPKYFWGKRHCKLWYDTYIHTGYDSYEKLPRSWWFGNFLRICKRSIYPINSEVYFYKSLLDLKMTINKSLPILAVTYRSHVLYICTICLYVSVRRLIQSLSQSQVETQGTHWPLHFWQAITLFAIGETHFRKSKLRNVPMFPYNDDRTTHGHCVCNLAAMSNTLANIE